VAFLFGSKWHKMAVFWVNFLNLLTAKDISVPFRCRYIPVDMTPEKPPEAAAIGHFELAEKS
jgi:hypothetical protein